MSQVSMSGSLSLYMQDSEYLKIQAELDREKKRQLTENEEDAADKNMAANKAVLERQLKEREAELDLKKSLQLEEADKKEQRQKEVFEAERTQNGTTDTGEGNEETSAAQQSQQSLSEAKGSETGSVTESSKTYDETEKAGEDDDVKQQMKRINRFETLQGHMRSLQNMNSLGAMFMQKISQTFSEIRTDSNDYNFSPYSKSITQKEAAKEDLEKRKESVDDRAGKTLRDTFDVLKADKTRDDKKQQSERMAKMQQNLSGLNYANTAFSHNVNFMF